MFEMLASLLAAAPIQARALGPEKRKRLSQNIAILAIDVDTFRPLKDFAQDADTLAAILKALPRQAGFDEILLPGERARPQRSHAPQVGHSDSAEAVGRA
jgi:LDH2 family malate/lactate/ureidoglycolate dehydrogenase